MKKILLISLLIVPLAFSGCSVQKKSTNTTAVPTPKASATALSDTSPSAESTKATDANSEAIETQYQENYATAAKDANEILQNQAKFCSVKVKFPGASVSSAGDQFFFFYSDSILPDYYWLEEFDGSNSNAKKRYFAARRDFNDEIACVKTQAKSPPSFVSSFQNYLTQSQIPNTTVILQMSLKDSTWEIIAKDATAATTSNGQVKVSAEVSEKVTNSPSASTQTSTDDSSL